MLIDGNSLLRPDFDLDWSFLATVFRNKTYNKLFTTSDEQHLYLLNVHNDKETSLSYIGQITLMRTELKPYLRSDNPGFIRDMGLCFQEYVPGIIVHVALNQNDKAKLAVVYRVLND